MFVVNGAGSSQRFSGRRPVSFPILARAAGPPSSLWWKQDVKLASRDFLTGLDFVRQHLKGYRPAFANGLRFGAAVRDHSRRAGNGSENPPVFLGFELDPNRLNLHRRIRHSMRALWELRFPSWLYRPTAELSVSW